MVTFGKWYLCRFPAIRHKNIYLETGLFWPWPQNSRGSRHRFHRCFTALSLIFWFMEDASSYTASVCARDVLRPFSIKVQVVTMVWHSLSACGFCGAWPLSSWGASVVTFSLPAPQNTGRQMLPPNTHTHTNSKSLWSSPLNQSVCSSGHTMPHLLHTLQSLLSESSSMWGAEIENRAGITSTTLYMWTQGQPRHSKGESKFTATFLHLFTALYLVW